MELLSYLLFALALNLDSFGAGLAYGTRQIRVPPPSLIIISLISVAAVTVSMLGGQILAACIPARLAHRLGGFMLLLIGLWVLCENCRARRRPNGEPGQKNKAARMLEIRIRPLGLVIQVLREPVKADLDSSGIISPPEALVLGAALAMDAFGAGFAVSMMGYSPAITATVVGLGHFLLTYLGILAGRTVITSRVGRQVTLLPGFLLISLGLLKLWQK
ncbi:predicted membrane protein [Pelotomaculum thermopropionicum SI]|uniref:Predicted membrane protein n=1 Tax=Pelotomaculum thermopropionicum (strain DSM 13744 / JCM 10971 / SI) TaxID=370438 RepID=A5D0T7_PELTS|nr:predicted membrane protein [Pelotomaculum thermopropionicum SI]